MSYIGNPPAEAYTNTVKDTFSGDGSTVAFTLSLPTTTNNVRVVVENVIQDPTVAYGVSGTTLTFTSAPPSGTNNIYVVHLGPAVQTVQPPTDLSGNFTLSGKLTVDNSGTAIEIDDTGSTYGEIGSSSSSLFVGTTDTGVLFYDAGDAILPFNPGTGTRDNAIDLGRSTDRFKDLYLSGGVYLGGTGSANYLDDYEEGTWTPTLSGSGGDPTGVTYLVQEGSYVKVGSRVFLNGYMGFTTYTGGAGNIQIKGIPFSIPNNNNRWSVGSCTPELISLGGGYTYMVMRARSGTSVLEVMQAGSNTFWGGVTLASAPSGATNKYFIFSVDYSTT